MKVFKALTNPKDCQYDNAINGIVYTMLWVFIIVVSIVSAMNLYFGNLKLAAAGLISSILPFVYMLYENYYLIEGCHAKKLLNGEQSEKLDSLMSN
jgi:hypothetical protein